MGQTKFSGPVVATNGFSGASLTINSGTAITKILKGTITVNPASVLTLATTEVTVTLTGAVAGDVITVNPPAAGLTAGMVVCDARVSATDEVKIRIFNGSAGTVDEASGTWLYTILRS